MKELVSRSLLEHSESLRRSEYSSKELTEAYISEIEQKDGELGAFITVTAERAMLDATEIDRKRASGEELSPLAGIPFAIKDNVCTKGVKTTCASKMLGEYVPPYDAAVSEKLKSAGAVLLGKTNMDEFAMGSTTENSAFMLTKNPLDLSRVPGGSSGGSAAAVAANEAVFALGSETGGSIRQPAAFCGVVGMNPTYGLVSRYGLVAYASSLDRIGPITKNVRDSIAVLEAISGKDVRDATSVAHVQSFGKEVEAGVKGLRIGIPEEFFEDGLTEDVKNAVMSAAKEYELMGAELVSVSVPSIEYALSAYYIISCSEASSNLARYDGVRYGYRAEQYSSMEELYKKSRSEGFGKEVKKRIMLGTLALSEGFYDAYYKKALFVKKRVTEDFRRAFEDCDVMIAPVAPSIAYKLGGVTPMHMYLSDKYTVPVNLAGLPSLSIPCGTGDDGMPVGMQIIGKAFSEDLLYRVGYAFEIRGGEK